MKYDAIIVGAGAAGLSAATAAASRGAHVLMLDCSDGADSDFAKSGGGVSAAGTLFQEKAGVADSPAIWERDIRRKANDDVEATIVRLVVEKARDALHFQAQELGINIHLVKNIPVAGHSVHRLHATPSEGGREYFEMFSAAASRVPGIDRMNDVEVLSLLTEYGRVRGVQARARGTVQDFTADFTVLACGGFAANRTMLREFAPEIADALHIGCPYNNGAGILWARELGAATSYLDSYQGHGHVTADHQGRLGLGLTTLGAILVDTLGRRFVREDIGPSELAAHVLAAPGGGAVELYDCAINDAASSMGAYRDCIARGAVVSAPTLEELAILLKIPVEPLRETVETANRAAKGEIPDPLQRASFGRPLTPPLFAARIVGALAHTQGGLNVDAQARVKRIDGGMIDGLLAAGGAVTCISGHGTAGYSSGNGLAQAFALGMIAGVTIAVKGGVAS